MTEEIKAILIFEMLGRPAEHLKLTLEQFIDKISKENYVRIINKKFNEPKKIEEAKELFTTFAEVEMNFKDLLSLFKIVFVYMPSHIEIISPSEIKIKNFELNDLMNELIRKLHRYDEIAKRLVIERDILQRQLQEQGVKPVIPAPNSTIQQAKEMKKAKKRLKSGKKKARKEKKEARNKWKLR